MKPFVRLAAGALALAGIACSAVPAVAQTLGPGLAAASPARPGGGLVHKISGCHAHPENHHVFLWGRPAWHRHGKNCAPHAASPPVYPQPYPGYNPYPAPAYPGYNPYPTPGYPVPGYPVAPAYCHKDWQNHAHPGFGGGWHRHAGPNCTPVRGRQWRSGPKNGCVSIAGIWICG